MLFQPRFQLILLLICILAHALMAQPTTESALETTMRRQGLVNVQTLDPTLLVSLAYSTTDNFVGRDVYGDLTRAYLQPVAARKLQQASQLLQKTRPDLRLLIYDAARPLAAQWKLWEALPHYTPAVRRNYVADPREGSIHNFGCAVDLTLATATGKPLDMGTKFDFFGPLAYPTQEDRLLKTGQLTTAQVQNRRLLRRVMQSAGFLPIEYEWWHFNALSRAQAKARFGIVK
jgi:zinc D-Ala-D-Ala dipeptidase